MGDYQALSSAISETLSGSVKKILVKSGSYVMTQPLIVGGTGVVIEGE